MHWHTWENIRQVNLIRLDPNAAAESILTGRPAHLQVKQNWVKWRSIQTISEQKGPWQNHFISLKQITSACSDKAFLFNSIKLTWSATEPQVESGGLAAAERQQWAKKRKRYYSRPGPHLSHNLTGQSTRRQILKDSNVSILTFSIKKVQNLWKRKTFDH